MNPLSCHRAFGPAFANLELRHPPVHARPWRHKLLECTSTMLKALALAFPHHPHDEECTCMALSQGASVQKDVAKGDWCFPRSFLDGFDCPLEAPLVQPMLSKVGSRRASTLCSIGKTGFCGLWRRHWRCTVGHGGVLLQHQ
ncbi:unnamed protein product [Durusdinium trenchii]|uniref:Uncharacterized protein n=2 Tax=Durusdinium trenchii TaxID=1381693 RepID=A0ABP0HHW2_9DINO